jgi:hypothetical protein
MTCPDVFGREITLEMAKLKTDPDAGEGLGLPEVFRRIGEMLEPLSPDRRRRVLTALSVSEAVRHLELEELVVYERILNLGFICRSWIERRVAVLRARA